MKFYILCLRCPVQLIAKPSSIDKLGLLLIDQHDHPAIKVQTLFQGFHDELQELVDIKNHGGRLADFGL